MMYDCEISNLRKVNAMDNRPIDPSEYGINTNEHVWVVSARAENFSGIIKLASGTYTQEELEKIFCGNGVVLPVGAPTNSRVYVENGVLVGLVDRNDCVIRPSEQMTR